MRLCGALGFSCNKGSCSTSSTNASAILKALTASSSRPTNLCRLVGSNGGVSVGWLFLGKSSPKAKLHGSTWPMVSFTSFSTYGRPVTPSGGYFSNSMVDKHRWSPKMPKKVDLHQGNWHHNTHDGVVAVLEDPSGCRSPDETFELNKKLRIQEKNNTKLLGGFNPSEKY